MGPEQPAFAQWQDAVLCILLAGGTAGAGALVAYKLHQPRAADCGDFAACYNNAGVICAFLAMAAADLVAVTIGTLHLVRRDARRARAISYAFVLRRRRTATD